MTELIVHWLNHVLVFVEGETGMLKADVIPPDLSE